MDWMKWAGWIGRAKRAGRSSVFVRDREEFAGFDIGRWTYGNPDVLKWDGQTRLKIGKFCSLAKGVRILVGGEHRVDWITTYPLDRFLGDGSVPVVAPATKGDVIIGNDVWIGTNVTILSGVEIGDGAVIGAGSVVTRDIEAYAIAAGNPAKVIRKRFDDAVIQALLAIKWWDWPDGKIKECIPLLMSGDLEGFLRKHAAGFVDGAAGASSEALKAREACAKG